MRYDNIKAARFIDRPNRFIAHVELDGRQEVCHVKTRAAAASCCGRGLWSSCRKTTVPPARPAST